MSVKENTIVEKLMHDLRCISVEGRECELLEQATNLEVPAITLREDKRL
jgi:hypothetical protein